MTKISKKRKSRKKEKLPQRCKLKKTHKRQKRPGQHREQKKRKLIYEWIEYCRKILNRLEEWIETVWIENQKCEVEIGEWTNELKFGN